MNTIELDVQGMTCGSCVKHVTKALQMVAGVSRVQVDLAHGRASVGGDLDAGGASLIAALASEGYSANLAASAAPKQASMMGGNEAGPEGKTSCCSSRS